MFIKTLEIRNFRSIENTKINFNKNLNIIIGSNNSGKTTIIDALRICLTYKDYASLRIKKSDFHTNKKNLLEDIEFNIIFKVEKEIETAIFSDLYYINPNSQENDFLSITYIFSYNQKLDKIKSKVFGGYNEDNPVSDEIFDYMLNYYLGALRDANRYLTPGRNNILSSFFSDLTDEQEKFNLINEINGNIKNSVLSTFITKSTENYIQKIYDDITFKSDNTKINMSPIDQEFDEFTKNWKIQLPLSSNGPLLEIPQNGLGYNNLIYISVLISRLKSINENRDEDYYISLCIEEPEAHLQPQLQNLFFSFLNSLNKDSDLQIFITSHSPTLTAKSDLNSLILIQNINNNVETLNLTECFTEQSDLNYLRKFLDVTKSQLLFSKKIIFVEGISEAILIPLFAKKYDFDLDKNGVEVVNVQGINFKHFIPLFDKKNRLNFKGVILTDDDRETIDGEPSDTNKDINYYCKNKTIKVYSSVKTFEYDLILSNGFDSEIYNQ